MRIFGNRRTKEVRDWMLWWWTWVREGYLERLFLINCPLFGLKVHWFYGPDWDQDCHDHPWWFVSFVVRGAYMERRQWFKDGQLLREEEGPRERWSFAFRRAEDVHKITWVEEGTITLILNGPKKRSWGFWVPRPDSFGRFNFVKWRTYLGLPDKQPEI